MLARRWMANLGISTFGSPARLVALREAGPTFSPRAHCRLCSQRKRDGPQATGSNAVESRDCQAMSRSQPFPSMADTALIPPHEPKCGRKAGNGLRGPSPRICRLSQANSGPCPTRCRCRRSFWNWQGATGWRETLKMPPDDPDGPRCNQYNTLISSNKPHG